MGSILRLKNFLLGRPHILDDFELKLVDHLSKALSEKNRDIFLSQIQKFNMVQRGNEINETEKKTTYLYWKEWGKIRRDFPEFFHFNEKEKEEKLADMKIEASVGIIDVTFWMIEGALFSIEFSSETGNFRPLDPDFIIRDTVIYV